jgi:hypothetical protein
MSLQFSVEQRPDYTVVRVEGEPTLDEFLVFVAEMGVQSPGWPGRIALFDLRSVRTLKAFTEHYAIGEAVARHLAHMHKIASVVPGDRLTRASEKTAKRSGVNLTVFTSEGEAIAWLLDDAA